MKHAILGFSAAAAIGLVPVAAAAQNSINVVVNGQAMQFDQPPLEQAGRVYVPLRGIFERLGASVVYQNGIINATGGGRNISLHIGSNQAQVNGQPQLLDSPPFVQGSRTLVPLRFIAQSLGAAVAWNNNTDTVTITGGGKPPAYNQPPARPMSPDQYLADRAPLGTVSNPAPEISAHFSVPMQRDSLRVTLDGRDVTSAVYFNERGFQWTPGRALDPGPHHIAVTGTTRDGANVVTGWYFRVQP
jgi:Copper amine oxidase N-terminal domain